LDFFIKLILFEIMHEKLKNSKAQCIATVAHAAHIFANPILLIK